MTMGFHKNHYVSTRTGEMKTISFSVPETLKAELLALSVALEEPRGSILLRLCEQYADRNQDLVAKGMKRIAPESRGQWKEKSERGFPPGESYSVVNS